MDFRFDVLIVRLLSPLFFESSSRFAEKSSRKHGEFPHAPPPVPLVVTTSVGVPSVLQLRLGLFQNILVGVTQHVAFTDWLLSLGNVHLSFLRVFLCNLVVLD